MGYQVNWLIENRLGCTRLSDTLSSDEADDLNTEMMGFISRGEAPVHFLIDMQKLEKLDYHIDERLHSTPMHAVFSHPGLGWLVYIIPKERHHTFLVITYLQRQFEATVMICHTRDEAMTFLSQQDSELNLEGV